MLQALEGVYRNGRIELLEAPRDIDDDTRVIVTFLPNNQGINLKDLGINEAAAAELRNRLASFEEDWNSPDMEVYDAVYAR